MSAVERASRQEPVVLSDRLESLVDDRTLEILERRRRTAVVRRRGWLVRRALATADALALAAAFLAAEAAVGGGGRGLGTRAEIVLFALTIPGWIIVAKLYGLYDRDDEHADHSTVDDLVGVFHMVTVGSWLFFAGAQATGLAQPNISKVFAFWVLAIALVTVSRAGARALCRRRMTYLQNTLIVGAGDVAQQVALKILKHPEYGINIVGFVDAAPKERRAEVAHLPILGSPDRLPALVRGLDIERVVIAFSGEPHEKTVNLVRSLRDVQVDVVPRLFEIVGPSAAIHTLEGLPLLGLPPVTLSRSSSLIKRAIDLLGAAIALIVTAPVFVVAAILIKRSSPGPVFFRQTRLGMNMKPFTMLKFRTMRDGTEDETHRAYIEAVANVSAVAEANGLYKLEREGEVTRVGRWLRRTSLDELPQMLNVIRGDMSLVGPRPCIPYEVQYFAAHHAERFLVPAGITGLWQVTARATMTFHEALDLDVAYARSWSLALDLGLLMRTVKQLLMMRTR